MSTPLSITPPTRAADLRAGVNVEIITVAWMIVEAAVAIAAGIVARSVLLTAFVEARRGSLARVERAENRAAWITVIALLLLCIYIVATSVLSLFAHAKPEGSLVGIGLAIAALIIMPWLVWRKRSIAAKISSRALRGDAACSLTCAQMAGALLIGVALNTVFGWWWADAVAALGLLYWIVPEAREALKGARSGRGGCGCSDEGCEL